VRQRGYFPLALGQKDAKKISARIRVGSMMIGWVSEEKRIETVAMSKVDHCDKPWDSGAVSV